MNCRVTPKLDQNNDQLRITTINYNKLDTINDYYKEILPHITAIYIYMTIDQVFFKVRIPWVKIHGKFVPRFSEPDRQICVSQLKWPSCTW